MLPKDNLLQGSKILKLLQGLLILKGCTSSSQMMTHSYLLGTEQDTLKVGLHQIETSSQED